MIAIYALWWESTDMVYIGQSDSVEKRFQDHLNEMKKGTHSNRKVQNEYDKYGVPKTLIIEKVLKVSDLDTIEVSWIKEFNSTKDGLNISSGGRSGRGDKSSGSKYSRFKVLRVFSLLYSTTLTHAAISIKTGMDSRNIGGIAQGTIHLNLEEEYPEQYHKMQVTRNICRKQNTYSTRSNKVYPELLGPDGIVYTIDTSVKSFCRTNHLLNIDGVSGLYAVLRGEKLSHKGFTLVDQTKSTITHNNIKPALVGPDGTIYSNITSYADFCRSIPLLADNISNAANSIGKIYRGAASVYKGFRLLNPL